MNLIGSTRNSFNRSVTAILLFVQVLLLTLSIAVQASPTNSSLVRSSIFKHQIVVYHIENKRHVFVFNTTNRIVAQNLDLTFETNATQEVKKCNGYYACRLIDGKFITGYDYDAENLANFDAILYRERKINDTYPDESSLCHNGKRARVYSHCSTHYHPPTSFHANECVENFVWHSPFSCNDTRSITNETPCFVYDLQGRLRDLTPLVRSDGTSYKVDASKFANSVHDLYINVCNEAEDKCGPLVSACYTNPTVGHNMEIGYSNSTDNIEWESSHDSVTMTYQGRYEPKVIGGGRRRETKVRFICPKQLGPASKPKLVQFNDTDSLIEWSTTYACPRDILVKPATDCRINSLGVSVDLRDLSFNQDKVLVEGININGTSKMTIGICSGLKKMRCADLTTKTTAACLVNQKQAKATAVGSIVGGTIRLEDTMVVLDYPGTELCHSPIDDDIVGVNRNITGLFSKKISTRVEYTCDPRDNGTKTPKFLGIDDCTYVFSWPSKHLCREMALEHNCEVQINETYSLDLRSLYRDSETPWEVLPMTNRMKLGNLKLNVCGLLNGHCDYSSSICLENPSKEFVNVSSASLDPTRKDQSVNLGIYKNATFNSVTNMIELHYTEGSLLNASDPNSLRRSTIVTLICNPTTPNEPPKLVAQDISSPITLISWKTPVACLIEPTPKPARRIAPVVTDVPTTNDVKNSTNSQTNVTSTPSPKNSVTPQPIIHTDDGHDLHKETHKTADAYINGHSNVDDKIQHNLQATDPVIHPIENQLSEAEERSHRFLMISLIIFTFASCGVVIFFIHKKTRIPRSLSEFRMTREHMSPQFSYRRVLNSGEHGDL